MAQLRALGDSLDGFDSEVRDLNGQILLSVQPVSQRMTSSFDELIGHTGEPIRLIAIRVDDDEQSLSAVVETRPGTLARSPVVVAFDNRSPADLVSVALASIVDDLAVELERLDRELN